MSSERRSVLVDDLKAPSQASIAIGPFGSRMKSDCYVPQGVKVVRGTNIASGRIFSGDFVFVTAEKAQELGGANLKPDDLVFPHRGSIGEVGIVPNDGEQYLISSSLMKLTCDPLRAFPLYIYYFFKSENGRFELLKNASQVGTPGIGQPLASLKSIRVTLPTLNEQKSIATFLGTLDDRITLLRETNATLEAIAQALFKSWFVDFDPVRAKAEGRQPEGMEAATAALFPDSFEESELGLVPRGWRVGTVADLATFQNGYAFKSKDWVESGHPVVKIGDVKPGIIDLAGCSFVAPESTIGLERFRLNRGDLLVGMTGYVGETGLVPTVQPSAYLNQRVGRFSTSSGLADLGFVYCLVRDPAFKVFAEAQSHGSAQANVSGAALVAYLSVIPSMDVLDQFNGVLVSVLEAVLSNYEQAQTLTQLRDTLLPRLISGQLRLPEAEELIEAAV